MLRRRGLLFCLVGPAGSGKTSHGDELLKEFGGSLAYSISATTRPPRTGETDGVHYHFLTRKDFESKVARGGFFEHEEVHGNLYGTLNATIEDSIRSGKDLLLDIDIRGALSFKKKFADDTTIIFLVPPSVEVLKARVMARGSVDEKELERRLLTAQKEYKILFEVGGKVNGIDYFVINDARDETYARVRAILVAERAKYHRQQIEDLKEICKI